MTVLEDKILRTNIADGKYTHMNSTLSIKEFQLKSSQQNGATIY